MKTARWLGPVILAAGLACGCGREGASTLSGRAVADGKPASGAEVNIYLAAERKDSPPVAMARTGDGGRFEANLAPGTYYVVIRQASRAGGPPLVSKVPADPVRLGKRALDVGDMTLSSGAGGRKPAAGSGVRGRVLSNGKPAVGAMVYLHADGGGRKGPSHYVSARTGPDGGFSLDAEPGSYFLSARKRMSGQSAGELEPGDLSGEYRHNPLTVPAESYVEAGDLEVSEIDTGKLDDRRRERMGRTGSPGISGKVTGGDGKAVPGVYVVAYDDYRMVGKPRSVSERTGTDGTYVLPLDAPGRYYVGARSTLGGPLEPGDLVGVYGGARDNSITAGDDGLTRGVDIVVREVE